MKRSSFLFLTFFSLCALLIKADEKPMVVIIPSYNNELWCIKNLQSVFIQKYSNYRVIFIDDASTDNTLTLVKNYIKASGHEHRCTVVTNPQRKGAMHNWYYAIHSCQDHEIVLNLDGDDWLAHDQVLSYLNQVYSDGTVWMTYGQYQVYPSGAIGLNEDFPQVIVENNAFRTYSNRHTFLPISHLRTYYSKLFKLIKIEDFLDENGNFLSMTCDKAIMAPIVEMARWHYKFIPDVLYIYNTENPISDGNVNLYYQADLMRMILARKPYESLTTLF